DAGPGCGSGWAAMRDGSDQESRGPGAPDGVADAAAARARTTASAAASSSGVGLPRTTLIITVASRGAAGGVTAGCRGAAAAGATPAEWAAGAGTGRCAGGCATA